MCTLLLLLHSSVSDKQITAHKLLWTVCPYLMKKIIFSLIKLYDAVNTTDKYRLTDEVRYVCLSFLKTA